MQITGGKFKGRKIKTVKSNDVRPTSSKIRGSIFSMVYSLGFDLEGKVFLDLFAGSGIMGIEAFSHGADKVIFIEKKYEVYNLIKQNLTNFDMAYDLLKQDALRFLARTDKNFDVIFIDPPYYEGFYEKVIPLAEEKLKEFGLLIIEAPVGLDINLKNIVKHKKYGDTQIFICKVM